MTIEAQAPVKVDEAEEVKSLAERLMTSDGTECVEIFRGVVGWCSSRDVFQVAVQVPAVQNAGGQIGDSADTAYEREVVGPRGLIERAIVQIDRLLAELDPVGRGREHEDGGGDGQEAGSPPALESAAGAPSEAPGESEP